MKLIDMPISYVGQHVVIKDGDQVLDGFLTHVELGVESRLSFGERQIIRLGRIEVSLDNGFLKAQLPHDAEVTLKGNPDDNS